MMDLSSINYQGSSTSQTNGTPSLTQLAPMQNEETLKGYLLTVGSAKAVNNTKTRLRTHIIPSDINGNYLESKLAQFLADLITDYCIPLRERQEANEELRRTQSLESANRLRREATDLLVKSEQSGEVGELLLYLLTERVLGAPQIISKMTLKTNHQVHYHGADGIHVKPTEQGLALYWGESKIHQDRAGAVRECLESVGPYLTDASRETGLRDLRLVRDNLDVAERALKNQVARFFVQQNPEWNLLEFRASCLVGFDLDEYPRLVQDSDVSEDHEIHAMISEWHTHLSNHIVDDPLESFEIDFFMVPFRDVKEFRRMVLSALGVPND